MRRTFMFAIVLILPSCGEVDHSYNLIPECWNNNIFPSGYFSGRFIVLYNPDGPLSIHSLNCGTGGAPMHFSDINHENQVLSSLQAMNTAEWSGGKFAAADVSGEATRQNGGLLVTVDMVDNLSPIDTPNWLVTETNSSGTTAR